MPEVLWPDLSNYHEIVDPDDVRDESPDAEWGDWPTFSENGTNSAPRPASKAPTGNS